MYRDSYALALMVDGKIQKEADDGTVLIPFGSEYALRLKNKLRKRAVTDVFIDGRKAAEGIVIPANGTVDLERFVENGQLSEGKKFKLVRVDDTRVEQPNDSENGIIEVNFYPEKDVPVIEKTVIHEYRHDCWNYHNHFVGHCSGCCSNNYCGICHPWKYTSGPVWMSSSGNVTLTMNAGDFTSGVVSGGSVGQGITSNSVDLGAIVKTSSLDSKSMQASVHVNNVMPMNASMNVGEAAATVQGSLSSQKFTTVYFDVDRSNPVTLRLKAKGLAKLLDACTQCGYKRKKDDKYCKNDGTQLVA